MKVNFTAEHISQASYGQNSFFHFAQTNGCRIELKLKGDIAPDAIEGCTVYFEPAGAPTLSQDFWLAAAVEDLQMTDAPATSAVTASYDLSDKDVLELLNESLVDLRRQPLH